MASPDWSPVEGVESLTTGGHVAEAAQPDESVWVVEMPELSEHAHADGLLRLDELSVEQLDRRFASIGVDLVAP
jgi:hypothetical protein